MRPFALLAIVLALPMLLCQGCVILPAEGRTMVGDVQETKIAVQALSTNVRDLNKLTVAWQDSFSEQEQTHYAQLRDRLIEIEQRLAQIERDLATVKGAAQAPVPAGAPVIYGPSARSTLVTTTGLTLTAEEMMRSAAELASREKYDEAAESYARVLALFPDSPLADDAQFGIASCLEFQKKYDAALTEFLKTPARYPDGDKAPHARFRAAVCARELGRSQQAISLLKEIILKHPSYEDLPQVKEELSKLEK